MIMKRFEVKQTMLDKGVPEEVMERLIFPEIETGTPEEKIEFVNQMDKLLTREQVLAIMEEQGCHKTERTADYMLKFKGKTIEERIEIINSQHQKHEYYCKLNCDGTLSVSWGYEDKEKYICICPRMEELSQPVTVSITYCGCCSGTIKHGLEQDLEVSLRLIEIVSSPLSSGGEKHCEHRYEIIKK